jgi:mono/diheme cytochrome c family protein
MKFYRFALVSAAAIFALATLTEGAAEEQKLPEAPGKALVTESCMQCHGVDVILARRRTPDEWSQTVSQMIGYGASLTDDQFQGVIAYLSNNLAKSNDAELQDSPKKATSG